MNEIGNSIKRKLVKRCKSCHINPFRDENVAELVRVISYCMSLEKALDKACEELENLSYVRGMGQVGMNFKEWKEWLKENVE